MASDNHSICPWWIGYLLACPVRRFLQNPGKILSPFVKEGMTLLDIGSAMGFFSLPMARLAGDKGKVVCVDLQEKMLASLIRRAKRKGLDGRIEPRVCSTSSLLIDDLKDKIDFALASAVMHETPDQKKIFEQVYSTLKKGAVMFVAEPAGHVSEDAFKKTLALAVEAGFNADKYSKNGSSFEVVLRK
jgi:ubiquinone/menaquinone biosynthesis C-methylase UbiE